jgi:hypothetical protein
VLKLCDQSKLIRQLPKSLRRTLGEPLHSYFIAIRESSL